MTDRVSTERLLAADPTEEWVADEWAHRSSESDRASAEGLREALRALRAENKELRSALAGAARDLAALRDTGPRPDSGIDVERLAEALHESDLMRRYSEYADAVPTMTPTPEHTLCIEWAAIIAREYARLSTPRTETSE